MTEHDDFDEFEELARRSGQSVRAEATEADAHLGVPVQRNNGRKIWAAGAVGLAAAAVIAIFVVTDNNEPKPRVTVANPPSTVAPTAPPITNVPTTIATTTTAPVTSTTLNGEPGPLEDLDAYRNAIGTHASGVYNPAAFSVEVEARQPLWRHQPYGLALAFVRALEGDPLGQYDIVETTDPHDQRRVFVATVPTDGDDSIRAVRYTLTVTGAPNWMLTEATWAQQCHQGRGHQDFTAEYCV